MLLASASLLVTAGGAMAQEAPAPSVEAVDEVVVTGSRLQVSGFETPVTVMSAEQLQQAQPSSVADALNQLPQFSGSTGPRQSPTFTLGQSLGNILNLRNVGPSRIRAYIPAARRSTRSTPAPSRRRRPICSACPGTTSTTRPTTSC